MGWGIAVVAAAAGAFWWFLWEYLLHRWAFHAMKGRGIGSREHLEHHVHAGWRFDPLIVVVWVGIALTGVAWGLLAGWVWGAPVGWGVGVGWAGGYYFYEYHHWRAHKRPPRNSWERWLRIHHFHHHFGHPMDNHGVTISLWDHVFRSNVDPGRVRVPRRLAMPWLLDADGAIRPEYAGDYELVGRSDLDERQAGIDRARAFANLSPTD